MFFIDVVTVVKKKKSTISNNLGINLNFRKKREHLLIDLGVGKISNFSLGWNSVVECSQLRP